MCNLQFFLISLLFWAYVSPLVIAVLECSSFCFNRLPLSSSRVYSLEVTPLLHWLELHDNICKKPPMNGNSLSVCTYLKATVGLCSFCFLFVFLVEVSMSGPGFLAAADPVTVNKTTGWISSGDSVKFMILDPYEYSQKTTSTLFFHSMSTYYIVMSHFVHMLDKNINHPCFSWSRREEAALSGMWPAAKCILFPLWIISEHCVLRRNKAQGWRNMWLRSLDENERVSFPQRLCYVWSFAPSLFFGRSHQWLVCVCANSSLTCVVVPVLEPWCYP